MPNFSSHATLPFRPERVFTLRGQRVLLDSDVANLYGVRTKQLNAKVRRNPCRFPPDFIFLLSPTEWAAVKLQISAAGEPSPRRRFLPYVFTECGALMAAGMLRSTRAVEVSIFVARASVV
jgi:hypothetical protein